jgi:5-methylcytosine-specific restriction endonuclease McrA
MIRQEFSLTTKQQALARQKYKCASCGATIHGLHLGDAAQHTWGESAQGHHIRHAARGGGNSVDNCVILCRSCHYSAHGGGRWRASFGTATAQDYPHYRG